MTFSVKQFGSLRGDGFIVPADEGFRLKSEKGWKSLSPEEREYFGNKARDAFVTYLNREYGTAIAQLYQDDLGQNGKPLEARHVRWVLNDIAERKLANDLADLNMSIEKFQLKPAAPPPRRAEADIIWVGNDAPKQGFVPEPVPEELLYLDVPLNENGQPSEPVVLAGRQALTGHLLEAPSEGELELMGRGRGPAASPGSGVEWPAAERIDFSTVAPPPAPAYTRVEQSGGSWLKDIDSGKRPDLKPIHQQNTPPQHELTLKEPEHVIFTPPSPDSTSGVPEAAPKAAPPVTKPPAVVQNAPPRQPRGMNPASFDRSRAQAQKDGSKLKRTDSKGKEPEEPRAEPKRTDAGNPQAAKVIKDTAWRDLSQVFKATIDHVAKAQDAAAKPPLGGSKKKAGKTEESKAAEPENKFELIGGERAFADLFAKPPKLDGLATALAKCKVETKNPLSVYLDLPKIMGDTPKIVDGHVQAAPGRHWLFRMRNAETKLDAEQVIREIDAFIAQLGEDIELIETLPLSKNERDRFSEVIARLHSIHQNIRDEFSPLRDLRKRCVEVQKVLPEDLPPIGQGHHYLAYVALTEQMGIFDLPTGTSDLVKLANRMLGAHNMVRRQLSEGNPWKVIYNKASPQMKPILEEYRTLRLAGIAKQVKSETGVTMNLVDGKDGKKICYFTSENRSDERQADYLLSTIAFSMGGRYRELPQVFGYVKWDLEDVAKEQEERAKEQAATA